MTRMRTLLVSSILLAAVSLAADDLESRARELETLIMAPCCGGGTVADHVSPASDQVRREVRAMLADGKSKQQILDHYVAQHGDTILSMPPARGFNLVAYWVPFVALIAGVPLVLWALRRWRAAPATPVVEPAAPIERAEGDEAGYEERLRRQLANLD